MEINLNLDKFTRDLVDVFNREKTLLLNQQKHLAVGVPPLSENDIIEKCMYVLAIRTEILFTDLFKKSNGLVIDDEAIIWRYIEYIQSDNIVIQTKSF